MGAWTACNIQPPMDYRGLMFLQKHSLCTSPMVMKRDEKSCSGIGWVQLGVPDTAAEPRADLALRRCGVAGWLVCIALMSSPITIRHRHENCKPGGWFAS
jgi:hypothetical protein